MNIAIIGNAPDTLIKFRSSFIQELVRQNHHVIAMIPHFTQQEKDMLEKMGVQVVQVPFSRFGTHPVKELASIYHLCRTFIEYKIDVCLCYFIKPIVYSLIAGFLTGVKRRVALLEGLGFFFTWDNKSLSLKQKVLKSIITFLFNISLPLAHKVVFLNGDDKKEVEALVPRLGETIVLGGIGVNLDEFEYMPPASNPRLTFVMVARILREKGVYEYLEAAKKLDKRDFRFILVGGLDSNPGGISEETLKDLLADSGVEWMGQVSDVRSYLRECDVFVLPSYREGVPRSTQEAMAIGRAIITSDVQGCRETVKDGQNGILIPARSAKALEEAFKMFKQKPELITSFGRVSRQIAEREFDSRKQDARLQGILLNEKTFGP